MQHIPFVDVDYCQFADWGYQKPTRVWGDPEIKELEDMKCPGDRCMDLVDLPGGGRGHRERLGGNNMSINVNRKYQVPERLIRYLCGWDK